MPDISLVNSAIAGVPKDYKLKGGQELLLKAVTANVNGASSGATFLPALQVLDPAGNVMFTAVNRALPVAAGGTANVSWFPGGGVDLASPSSSSSGGITKLSSNLGTLSVTNQTGPFTSVDMPTTGVTAGSYGDSSHSAEITVDAEGRITSATSVGIAGGSGTIGFEVGYDQKAAATSVVSITESSGTTVIACAAHTFDGAPVLVTFFCPIFSMNGSAGAFTIVSLFEGATQIGRLCAVVAPVGTAFSQPLIGALRFTPSAASHTYTVSAFISSGGGFTSTITGGAGGTGTYDPCFVRFTKV